MSTLESRTLESRTVDPRTVEARARYVRSLTHQLILDGWERTDRHLVERGDVDRKELIYAYLRDSLIWAFEELQAGRPLYAFRGLVQAAGYAGEVGHDSITSDAFSALKNEIEDVIHSAGGTW